MPNISFEPSAERGAALDRRMRERLADTLDYVFGEVGETLGVTPQAAAAAAQRVRVFPQSPHIFGAYYEMVLAIEQDEIADAQRLAAEILTTPEIPGLSTDALEDRDPLHADRYRRMFLPEPDMAQQPDVELMAETRGRIGAALQLLDRGFPGMADEARELLREIVVAAGPEDPKALTFDGASSYMLWGAVLLNARGQKNVLDTAQALAHESGHNLLFGFCASGSLVENADEELFSSPLRADPRPMDGVFHATYVIARMHQTLTRLIEAGVLTDEEAVAAQSDLEAHRRNFEAGDAVIREGGRLTPLGVSVIESARAYMATA